MRDIDAIAETDGIDVLFVGPSDLTHAMGIPGEIDHPRFRNALAAVAAAGGRAGKAVGTVLIRRDDAADYINLRYRVLCCSSDGGLLASASRDLVKGLRAARDAAVQASSAVRV